MAAPDGSSEAEPPEFPWSESVAFLLRDAYRSFAKALQNALEPHGVNAGSWVFLRHLWEKDGLTQRELTDRVGLMQPNTNAALKQLARRGLIRQTIDPKDRRKLNIYLTAKGKALRATLIPLAVGIRDEAVAGISAAELRSVSRILSRMKDNLRGAGEARRVVPQPRRSNGTTRPMRPRPASGTQRAVEGE